MKERFVLANVFDTKFAIWIHALRMSPAFEHNNAPNTTMKHIVKRNMIGFRILILVS